MSLNPQLKEGDRVVCYYMEGETSNVPIGTTGTVTANVYENGVLKANTVSGISPSGLQGIGTANISTIFYVKQ